MSGFQELISEPLIFVPAGHDAWGRGESSSTGSVRLLTA